MVPDFHILSVRCSKNKFSIYIYSPASAIMPCPPVWILLNENFSHRATEELILKLNFDKIY